MLKISPAHYRALQDLTEVSESLVAQIYTADSIRDLEAHLRCLQNSVENVRLYEDDMEKEQ